MSLRMRIVFVVREEESTMFSYSRVSPLRVSLLCLSWPSCLEGLSLLRRRSRSGSRVGPL